MNAFLGLDLGTSGLKAVLVNGVGAVLATAKAGYPTRSTGPGHAEQDPADWLSACRSVCADLDLSGVAAVGVVGHTPSLVLAGDRRQAVRDALIWQDSRATVEAARLAGLGRAESVVGGALPWSPAYLPAKLGWLAAHDPAAVSAARALLQPKDFLGLAATGVAATDIWSSKGLCRIDDGRVVAPVFAAVGVSEQLLPQRLDPWATLGSVDEWGARLTGLPVGSPLAVGWTDALGGMVALGAFGRPTAFAHTGTSDIVGASHTGDFLRSPGAESLLHIPAGCAPLPVAYGPTQTSGAALSWLAGALGRDITEVLESASAASLSAVPLFLPFLDGERAPLWKPELRAVMRGISLTTSGPELARAVLRGVALADRHVLSTAPVAAGDIHVGGSSAMHPAWVQARLECWGRPIVLHANADVAAAGAAVLAATAVQDSGSLGQVADRMAGSVTRVEPTDDQIATAERLFRSYRSAVAELLAS